MGENTSNWLSAITGVVGAIIAVATLLTVYVAATQISSRRQIYQLGLSESSLGPWQANVVSSAWFGMRRQISTPTISVRALLKGGWQPNLALPQGLEPKQHTRWTTNFRKSIWSILNPGGMTRGLPIDPMLPLGVGTSTSMVELKRHRIIRAILSARPLTAVGLGFGDCGYQATNNASANQSNISQTPYTSNAHLLSNIASASDDPEAYLDDSMHAAVSWVNFLQGLGLSPSDKRFYQMQPEPELVNGMVPMRWKGRDLAALCSVLGFQSCEDKPSAKKPMPLPTQWSGPLGWLQFRPSSDGCIVEFRVHRAMCNQFTSEILDYYEKQNITQPHYSLVRRLWQSIGGLYLSDGQALYLGGTDSKRETYKPLTTTDDICAEAMARAEVPRTDDDMRELLWGKRSEWPTRSNVNNDLDILRMGLSELLPSEYSSSNQLQLMDPCPGLLSTVAEGTWADSRGLQWRRGVYEYHRDYVATEERKRSKHPYQLGRLCMDAPLLELLKDAVNMLKPDGFYFSPAPALASDLQYNIYGGIREELTLAPEYLIHPDVAQRFGTTAKYANLDHRDRCTVYHAIEVCNSLQRLAKLGRAHLSVTDMKAIGKTSAMLSEIIKKEGASDFSWALIYSPMLFADLLKRLGQQTLDLKSLLANPPMAAAANPGNPPPPRQNVYCERGTIVCRALPAPSNMPTRLTGKYKHVKLVEDQDFSNLGVLTSFLEVVLCFYWIKRSWVSDVGQYDTTIPQTVTMV